MKFRKKPIVIEAMQFNGASSGIEIQLWITRHEGKATLQYVEGEDPLSLLRITIDTLEGCMIAQPGDWIIKGVKGEFYPCKPDIFEATYEPA